MKKPKRALLQVSLKILLRNGKKVLLTKGFEGDIDLPGGRIDLGEEETPLEDIIAREVREELSKDVKFRLGPPLFVNRVFRKKDGKWIFTVVFDAKYISGDIMLSDEHKSYEWVDRESYKVVRKDFLPIDQEKYEAFKQYFHSSGN
jgi:8-oxo-dGTP pyrophosphatase MutT (NUDIX family)